MLQAANGDPFDAIRPYRDDEVRAVLARLRNDDQLLQAVAAFSTPRAARLVPGLARHAWRQALRLRTRNVGTVRQFQQFLEAYFVRLIARTTQGFSWTGVERLERGRGYLFVGNHRDIALDSAFLNYALWREGHDTARIAIGDNLLQRAVATDLMRLNKSFIVRRNLSGPKEMLAAYLTTSRYLYHSLDERQSVWIAQRDGRAKDGWDATDPAIVKMFVVSRRKSGERFGAMIAALRIVPVAISYELDPCDSMKAHELAVAALDGRYEKPADEDLLAIVRGITGQKGRVHLAFGEPIGEGFGDADAVAAEIDRQIVQAYRLWPTHHWAAAAATGAASIDADAGVRQLRARLHATPVSERPYLLLQYANPVRRQLGLAPLAASSLRV